ncbi:heavy-metal-associated domain-containing protein [Georgenia subflava]|uniref:Copper-transporting ATPase n=1 Tax=Georgenia subflava TaxID=1622177 RepID=A0A6N7EFU0_9MICO|nr:heavy metal-associated domain-containing protein [Georgenia subflava]MPV36261.1 copper-transporting ATPase [Georgenia subflava]
MRHTPRTFVGTATFEIAGLTCRHCGDAVAAAVRAVPGIDDVHVDLATGAVTVTARRPVDRADVDDALDAVGHLPQH